MSNLVLEDLDGARVLVLGTSPALHRVPLDAIAPSIITLGVNRVWPVYQADFIQVSDEDIEDAYLPAEGELRGQFLTPPQLHRFAGRSDARFWEYYQADWVRSSPPLPSPRGRPIPSSRNGAGYAVALALSYGAAEVGVIGVDYNKEALRAEGKPDSVVVSPKAGLQPLDPFQLAFWAAAAQTGRVFNLSPVPDSPFNQTDLPRLPFADWVARWVGGQA